jgi:hypothetical protein
MDSSTARRLFEQFAASVAYVDVIDDGGRPSIGTAFHVGDGVFVTARHVVADKRISEIATTARARIRLDGSEVEHAREWIKSGDETYPVHSVSPAKLELIEGPYFHPTESVDVAVFKTRGLDARCPYVPLGSHLDDWVGESDFVLSEALISGVSADSDDNASALGCDKSGGERNGKR